MSLWYESNLILIQTTFIYLVLALSIQLPMRWGVLSFAGLGCFGIGAYAQAILTTRTGIPQILILLICIVLGAVASLTVGMVCVRLSGMYLAMATLAFDLIVGVVALNGGELTGGVDGLYGVVADVSTLFLALLAVVALVVALYTERARTGRMTTVVREDPELGLSLGLNVRRFRQVSFFISGALGACSGVMYVRVNTTITPENIQFGALVVVMTMVIVGGWKASLGTLAGAVIFTWLPSHLGRFATWQTVIYSSLVLVVAVGLPTGFAGVAQRIRRRLKSDAPAAALGQLAESSASSAGADSPSVTDRHAVAADAAAALSVQDVAVHFGGVKAVDGISFDVRPGEIFGILGPNGSGKSTLLAAITRFVEPTAGRIQIAGIDTTHARPYMLGRMGVARSFQTVRLLEDLTILENVLLGDDVRAPRDLSRAALHDKDRVRRAESALARVGLSGCGSMYPSELSYGRQRRVEMARAIMARPSALLLDEPVAGMNRHERSEIRELLSSLRDDGMTLVLIEHDVELMVALCDRLLAMNFGQEIATGTPSQVVAHPAVREAYLGKKAAQHA